MAAQQHPSSTPKRQFYGRRKGKSLKPSHLQYLEEDFPNLSLPVGETGLHEEHTSIDLKALFGNRPVWLEIGFGAGEHIVHQAAENPHVGLIGADPYLNGVAALLGKIRKTDVTNVRIHHGDVRDVFDVLPAACLQKAFLLYPDPWPKARHHRRRFVTSDYLVPLARVLQPQAELRVATDIPDYVRQSLLQVPRHGFRWAAEGPDDWRTPWPDWLSTRYEQKALRDHRRPYYLTFIRES